MKKAKLTLIVIWVLAIVGGAFAFKTKFGNNFCVVSPSINPIDGQLTCKDGQGYMLFCENSLLNAITTDECNPDAMSKCTAQVDPIMECYIECPVLTCLAEE